jgi:hypothetical protein
MKIISFSRTTAALLARRKSVTRRLWKDTHAARFSPGELVQAWSASPHRGGERVGVIRIKSVTREPTHQIPDSDWEAEGFAFMQERGINVEAELSCSQLWEQWRSDRRLLTYVVRFEVVKVGRRGK